MANIFIIHGAKGDPEENWFPWLRGKLELLGHQVFVPQFPTPENQTLFNWLSVLESYKQYLTSETIFVAHSLGVPFLLNVLEKYPAKAAFLVAGFFGKTGNEFDNTLKTFAQKTLDWQQIKKNCQNFVVFHSDDDPFLRLEKGQELAEQLGVALTLVKGSGHFNETAGYQTFDLLLEKIKSILILQCMTQVKLFKLKLKKGNEHLWLDWCEELKSREPEVIETLKNEGVVSESCFLSEDEKCVYYFMEAQDFEYAKQAVQNSHFKIDAEHRKRRELSLEIVAELKELFHFENRN